MTKKLNMEAPWYSYQKKIAALFEHDRDIIVGPVEMNKATETYEMGIEVRNHQKFIALDTLLRKEVSFGNVKLVITLYDEENATNSVNTMMLYNTLFSDNPLVRDIIVNKDFTNTDHEFIRFEPEVIQFFNDDISDYNGNWSGLAQDIAKEIFYSPSESRIHFCTAPKIF